MPTEKRCIRLPSCVIHGPQNCTKAHGVILIRNGPKNGKHRSIWLKQMTARSGCLSTFSFRNIITLVSQFTSHINTRSSSFMQARDSIGSRSITLRTNICISLPRPSRIVTTHVESAIRITTWSSTSRMERTSQ